MKKLFTKFLACAFACVMAVSVASPFTTKARAEEGQTGYEIYPTPHDVQYKEGDFIVRDTVNAVVEQQIDEATRNRLNEVMAIKNKTVEVTDAKTEDASKTNILIGVKNSGGYVDNYVKANYTVSDDLFTHYGAYFMAANNGEIVILGKDTDAAFYGLTSLKWIFNQIDGSTIRNFEIKDYADVNIRGFIEGYYGIPWSPEGRMSLMKFGGDFKMTSYIFAPKDDPYHTSKWRELYPTEELESIKQQVAVGNASKCHFVWTAHPFMGGFNANDVDGEIAALLRKFDQLYEAGVRQFGVLGDDVGNLNKDIVVRVMNAVSDWAKKKGDCYDTVFCPAGYNHSWQGNYSELNTYDAGFPEDVQIFWTGEAVCQPIEQKTLDHFRRQNKQGDKDRRAPLFWLNWPVNDINHSRMLMGKGELLHTDINPDDLYGAVSNPMQESEASKVAIFALADYTWNIKGFNADKSWADSFKYIEPDCAEDLHTLAKHMSNPAPNGHGLTLSESVELKPVLDEFKAALANGTVKDGTGDRVISEMETIINACDGFQAKSKNQMLKDQLKPFTDSLKDLTTAIRDFTKAEIALENNDNYNAFNLYTSASDSLKRSQNHLKPAKGNPGYEAVDPGSTELIPLAAKLQEKLSGPVNDYITGGTDKPLTFTAESNITGWHSGSPANIIDGNNNTHAWSNGYEAAGQYFQVNFSKPATVYGVHILNGANQNDKHQDTFGTAKIVYKTEGSEEWKQVGDNFTNYAEHADVNNAELKNVVAMRYECVAAGSSNKWPAMREFRIATEVETTPEFTKEVIRTSNNEGWSVNSGSEANIIDGNPATNVHFNVRQHASENVNTTIPGDYIGVKLSQPITLGKIHILQGRHDTDSDFFMNCDLEYSMDGTHWTKIQSYENKREISVDLSDQNIQAQYVRLKNTKNYKYWVAMREFDVDAKVLFNSKADTNVDALKDLGANVLTDKAELAAKDGITLAKDQYVGIKLDRIHELKNIEKTLENETGIKVMVSANGYEWTEFNDKKPGNARYIRLVNKTEQPVTFNVKKFVVNTVEVYPKSVVKAQTNYNVVSPNNVFDGDRTTQTIFQNSQNQGMKVVYDLGQTIHFDTFKAVCRDSEIDYPRHAKFSISADGEHWEDILTIGKQDGPNEGEAANNDNIMAVMPLHETSYNAAEAKNINKDGRYLKFEITRTKVGNDKWVRFQEFEINGGAYVPEVNDPTFTSEAGDTRNGRYQYLTDGSLATAFVPAKDTGSLVYTVSENNDYNVIKFVQGADAISNAVVSVRFNGEKNFTELGKLSQTVNEFAVPSDKIILDIKLAWNGTTPAINEMVRVKGEYAAVNKDALNALLTETVDTSKWTTSSKAAYDKAIATGNEVKDNAYASQATIDTAVAAIESAKSAAKNKADVAVIDEALKNAVEDKENYTVNTWRTYEQALNALKDAKKNIDNTSAEQAAALVEALNTAKTGLVFNPTNRELAQIAIAEANAFIASLKNPTEVYTEASWNAFVGAKTALEGVLANTETHPVDIAKATKAMKDAKDALKLVTPVEPEPGKPDTTALAGLMDAAKPYLQNKASYTTNSVAALEKALSNAEAAMKSDDQKVIDEASNALSAAIKNMRKKATADQIAEAQDIVNNKLNASQYTADSYAAYDKAVSALVGALKDQDNLSKDDLVTLKNAVQNAEKGLVTVTEQNNNANNSTNNNAGVQTGVYANPLVWVGVLAAAVVVAGAVFFIIKKKK